VPLQRQVGPHIVVGDQSNGKSVDLAAFMIDIRDDRHVEGPPRRAINSANLLHGSVASKRLGPFEQTATFPDCFFVLLWQTKENAWGCYR